MKEVLQQQLQSIASAQALRPIQERQLLNRGVHNSSFTPASMHLTLDNSSDRMSLSQIQNQSSTTKNQVTAGYLNAA